ncbi:peptidase [Flammeovirga pectinis]|uniref:Peptidase n=1 Tax=Flammeovirga pectinis TaxID=2494373 RepID=A0A3Q9FN13_9BACT|nr:RimK/LysX family protein [Flammeovirga pectinis]AZQ60902.1 peptidase [Flammeovirga pectinis]
MKIIGRVDKVDFPELSLKNIKVKVDTGAYTSSIHCSEIKEIEVDQIKKLTFKVLDSECNKFKDKVITEENYQKRSIKSSFGDSEERFIIQSEIILFNTTYPIELSLTNRRDMKYPILIGRKFLSGKFIVDTSIKNQSYFLKI